MNKRILPPFLELLAFLLILLSASCKAQPQQLRGSGLVFKSIFGIDPNDSTRMYCLLGTGFLRARSSANSDSLIDQWISAHPNAEIIPVSTLVEPEFRLTYCWLAQAGDTLNYQLIKNGCFPGGTMMRPQRFDEMSERVRKGWDRMEKPRIEIHVDAKSYDAFIERTKEAEEYARANHLGIWAD